MANGHTIFGTGRVARSSCAVLAVPLTRLTHTRVPRNLMTHGHFRIIQSKFCAYSVWNVIFEWQNWRLWFVLEYDLKQKAPNHEAFSFKTRF